MREGRYGVLLSFYADNRAVTLRGGVNMHVVAEAIEDCKLETITVFHRDVWEKIPNEIEIIDRIAIDTLPVPGQETVRSPDDDDFDDDELPGERPLS